jgi:hypothetical protein
MVRDTALHTGTAGDTPIMVDAQALKSEALVTITLLADYALSDSRPDELPIFVEETANA